MVKRFNYVIAHPWENNPDSLAVYAYYTEVHYGTKEDAKELLEYVKRKSPCHDWKIYKIRSSKPID